MKKIIAVNAGSSSLKFKLYDMPEEKVIAAGIYERIGLDEGIFKIEYKNGKKQRETLPFKDHSVAVSHLIEKLISLGIIGSLEEISGVGHRVVQGGKYFSKSVEFNNESEKVIESLICLAPIHNGANLIGYRAFKEILPNVYQSATFDTAFHQTMEPQDYVYPIPYFLTTNYDIRRYGFHGTSHRYVSEVAIEKYLKDKEDSKIIVCHLGSGSSITAIRNGKSVATTMGLTPLGGIMMGTRTGDMDPSVMAYICKQTHTDVEKVNDMFNKQSGFLGVSGISSDTRDVEAAYLQGNSRAKLAIELFTRRVLDFIGQYYVRLGGCDLIAFTAGIGENATILREFILDGLKESLGVEYDKILNNEAKGGKHVILSTGKSKVAIAVIPTDEEVIIARDCYELLNK